MQHVLFLLVLCASIDQPPFNKKLLYVFIGSATDHQNFQSQGLLVAQTSYIISNGVRRLSAIWDRSTGSLPTDTFSTNLLFQNYRVGFINGDNAVFGWLKDNEGR